MIDQVEFSVDGMIHQTNGVSSKNPGISLSSVLICRACRKTRQCTTWCALKQPLYMHEGFIPFVSKNGHCEGLYWIKLLSCRCAMRSLTLELRSSSLHRIERPPKKAMTYIYISLLHLRLYLYWIEAETRTTTYIAGTNRFFRVLLLMTVEYLLSSVSLWDVALPQKPISTLSRAFWTIQSHFIMVRITYHVYQVRL